MNLPNEFVRLMEGQIGTDETSKLVEAITTTDATTNIRTNPCKPSDELLSGIDKEPIPWCPLGHTLKERPSFTMDPLFHAGCYYVQEASSQFLWHVLRQHITDTPIVALDLCAAPGGKSTLALSALPTGSLLISNDIVRQRAQILSENITKWGNPNSIVTCNAPQDFQSLGAVFDLIICDAPCSGEGMFRKDEGSISDWSLGNVDTCWRRQRDIITDIWPTLNPGGILIYSTCTYNSLEDEDNVEWICKTYGAERLPLNDDSSWHIRDGHFFPHLIHGEGFFISVLRKPEDSEDTLRPARHHKASKGKGKDKSLIDAKILKELKTYIYDSSDYTFGVRNVSNEDRYYCMPTEHNEIAQQCLSNLYVLSLGIELATIKGKRLQPSHSLAMSTRINKDVFEVIDIDHTTSISYLRTEAITLPADTPQGYVLLTYKHIPIGFGKNIGNRVNNLYPNEWKIRK